MKKLFLFVIILWGTNLFAQEEVKIKSGRTIVIMNNGRWIYKPIVSEYGSFTDTRDQKIYTTVTFGDQTWLADNLQFKAGSGVFSYENNSDLVKKFGYLYEWETAKTSCPAGWHLPTEADWAKLTSYLEGEAQAGGRLKEMGTTHWNSPNTGANNESGFTALPSGIRNANGEFIDKGNSTTWWSADVKAENVICKSVNYNSTQIITIEHPKNFGLPVRCIKN